jgi:phosphate transport system substrate-binding protein
VISSAMPSKLAKKISLGRGLLAATAAVALSVFGANTAQAQARTERDGLWILASGSTSHVSRELIEAFSASHQLPARPRLDILPTPQAFEALCAGVGGATPDIFVTSRRMAPAIKEYCRARGVTEIIELQIGVGSLILAAKSGDPLNELSSADVWRAVGAEVPRGEEFIQNRARQWREVSPSLPNSEIRLVTAAAGGSSRAYFEDLVLEAGCRHDPTIMRIFEARYRRAKCITMRQDGRIVERRVEDIPGEILRAPPGTIGTVTLAQVRASGGTLVPIKLDDVLPTSANISNLDYLPTFNIFMYAKRQHSRAVGGVGVVRGIREFSSYAMSEQVAGPEGRLATNTGLVSLRPDDRVKQRRTAASQTILTR